MMQLTNLTFSYGSRTIFDHLALTFAADKVNMIIGPNGVGKSTLLDILAGLYDRELPQLATKQIPDHRRIAYTLQNPVCFTNLTVKQTLKMYQEIDHAGGQQANAVMQRIKGQVLDPLSDTKARQLSGGERRLLVIYGTCLLDRDLYLFDEPLSGVDPRNRQLVLALIASLVTEQRKQVIMTNHQLEDLTQLPLQVIALAHGRCVFNDDYVAFIQQASSQNATEAFDKLLAD